MNIIQNLDKLKSEIPPDVSLVIVTKTRNVDQILKLYKHGHKSFGENRVQEFLSKKDSLPQDIDWHFIGHLQSNKAKYLIPSVALIHSVDSEKLMREINKQAQKIGKIQKILLQIKIAQENTKFGLNSAHVSTILEKSKELSSIKIVGLMSMASFVNDIQQVENEFSTLNKLFSNLKKDYSGLNTLSIGMTNDYPIAIKCGSTLVRIGTKVFGPRL